MCPSTLSEPYGNHLCSNNFHGVPLHPLRNPRKPLVFQYFSRCAPPPSQEPTETACFPMVLRVCLSTLSEPYGNHLFPILFTVCPSTLSGTHENHLFSYGFEGVPLHPFRTLRKPIVFHCFSRCAPPPSQESTETDCFLIVIRAGIPCKSKKCKQNQWEFKGNHRNPKESIKIF